MSTINRLRYIYKPIAFGLMLWPAAFLTYHLVLAFQGLPHDLGFNPIETIHHQTGDWALRFLLLSLVVTPLSWRNTFRKIILFRRMIGLFAAFYSLLHVLGYLGLDLQFNMLALWHDVLKRNYITVGMVAFILLIPLTLTSFQKAVKYLGASKWRRLHQSVYLVGVFACVHFIMMRKGFQLEPLIYLAIYISLMTLRWQKKWRRQPR